MRWVVVGNSGQLGSALEWQLEASEDNEVLAAVDLPEVDASDPAAVKQLFERMAPPPDVVMNAAAFTHVDRCEREPEAAKRANTVAPELLAVAARDAGARFVHVSTDYVFAGDSDEAYREDDPPGPRSTYGRSKLAGERRVSAVSEDALIVRTSWVFGRGRNFLAAILSQAAQRRREGSSEPLRVVDDQRGRPTYASDLAEAIRALVEREATGCFHVANEGIATWWELARFCLDEAGFSDLEVERIRTSDLELDAPRPAHSVLDLSKAAALGIRLRSWQDAVREYLVSEGASFVELGANG